jgi:two-component system sensor histidine kinase RegB
MVTTDTQAQPQRARVMPVARASAVRGRVRLRTLSNLRWMATAGQTTALLVVYFGFGYSLPLVQCLACVAFSAGLNIVLAFRYPPSHRLTNREATVYLAYDVLQLAALLYLTGGIANPFALMFVAPVVIAASTLNLGNTLILGAIALASASLISVAHEPLPWSSAQHLILPQLYQAGLWASLVLGIGFTSVYAWRIASEGARMSAGLAATQLALAREQRLSSLGALATAAAHELGSPLGTIAVVAHELERVMPANSQEAEDMRLLRSQARGSDAGRHRASAAMRLARRHRRHLSRGRPGHRHCRCALQPRRAAAPGLARPRIVARAGQHHRKRRRLRQFPRAHRGRLERRHAARHGRG